MIDPLTKAANRLRIVPESCADCLTTSAVVYVKKSDGVYTFVCVRCHSDVLLDAPQDVVCNRAHVDEGGPRIEVRGEFFGGGSHGIADHVSDTEPKGVA